MQKARLIGIGLIAITWIVSHVARAKHDMALLPLALALVFLLTSTAQAAAFSLQVCVDQEAVPPNYYVSTFNGDQRHVTAYVEFVSQSGNALAFGDWGIERPPGSHAWGGIAINADSGVELHAWNADGILLASLTIDGNESYPRCGIKGGWQPGAPSIAVPLVADCQFIQTVDKNGNWHWVESDGQRVLVHWGDSLIGNPSNGQSTDPAAYRAFETPCPG